MTNKVHKQFILFSRLVYNRFTLCYLTEHYKIED